MRIVKFMAVFLLLAALAACQAPLGDQMSTPTVERTQVLPADTPTPAHTFITTSTPTAAIVKCTEENGTLERVIFKSSLLEKNYTVSIYTPPCYGKETQATTYPVLYLFHGQNMDDTFWLSLGAAEIIDGLIAEGGQPFLMVMPYEVDNFDPPTESKFGDSIINELIPWIEENYSVCTTRSCRAVGGISRGGGWALRLAMRNFDLFGAVGAHSPGPMAGDWWQAQKHLETHTPEDYPRIYIDRGEDDFLKQDIDSFEKVLYNNGIPHEFIINPGSHNQAYWQQHVAEYLRWYAEGFQNE